MKINFLQLMTILLVVLSSLKTTAQDCIIPQSILDIETLGIAFDNLTITSDSIELITGYFKMPGNSSDVKAQSDIVRCKGYMPGGVGMIATEILSISGLPKGILWKLNNTNNQYGPGETGCLYLSGRTVQRGTFPFTINLTGTGSLFGIKKSYTCVVDEFAIIVK